MPADGDPTPGRGAECEKRLRGAVDSDHLFGLGGAQRGGVPSAPARGEPELGRGVGEPLRIRPVVVIVDPPLEGPACPVEFGPVML